MSPVDRTAFNALVDGDGTSASQGTPWDKAHIASVLLDPTDAALAPLEVPKPAGAKVFLRAINMAGLAAAVFTEFSTLYDKYEIELEDVTPNSIDDLVIQPSSDGGATWFAGVMRYVLNYAVANSGSLSYVQSYNSPTGAALATRVQQDLSGTVVLYNPLGAKPAWSARRYTFSGAWAGDGPGGGGIAWGSFEDTQGDNTPRPYNALQVKMRSGGLTFVSGYARLYGIAKS